MPRRPGQPDDDLDDLLDDDEDEDLLDDDEDDDDLLDDALADLLDGAEADLPDAAFVDAEDFDGEDWGEPVVDEEDGPVEDDPTGEIDPDDWPAAADDGEAVEWDLPEVVLPWAGVATLPELGRSVAFVLSPAAEGSTWHGAAEARRALIEIGPVRARLELAPGEEGPERLVLGRDFLAGRVLVRVPRDQAGSASAGDG